MTLHEHETQEAFGTGSDDRGMKSAGDGTIIERGTPQLSVQELGQEQQLTMHEHETQEAFGTGSDDRGMKSAGDGTIVERGTPQLNVQEMGQEHQLMLHEHETQEAFSEHEGETQGAFLKLEEETQEAFSEHEQEQRQKQGEAGPASRSASLEGPALTALRKFTINGNIPPILSSRTRSRRPHIGVEGAALVCFLPAIEAEEENGVEDALACDDEGQMAMQATLDIPEPRNRRQAMESAAGDGFAGMGRMAEGRGD